MRTLASLNHPNIATIYGLEEVTGTPHLVLELIEGETLAAQVARGPLRTVRRSGSRLRITVQMVNVADGYQLWSERYDRQMTDVFEVQDEIATAIVTRLRGTMQAEADLGRAARGTRNLEAYDLVLRGRALQIKRGRFVAQAIACFEQAIAIDPQYAEALASLSDSYRLLGVFGTAAPADAMPKAAAMAERALEINPALAEAWTTLAAVEEQHHRNFARSDSLYDRALLMEPRNSQARAQRALWRLVRGAMPTRSTPSGT